MQDKVIQSLEKAIQLAGLEDGMTISFHHHLRNGDHCMVLALRAIEKLGIKDLTINASSFFDSQAETVIDLVHKGVITGLECNYMASQLGTAVSHGLLKKPVLFRTHGGRAYDLARGASPVDVAFIAAPTADRMGNLTGKEGPAACGSLGYAFADAEFAKKTIAVTDNLVPAPLASFSIAENFIDYVVEVESIGDPAGIVSGTTKVTRDPVGLLIAEKAAQLIEASGLLQDGFSFQTGAGGTSLAVAAEVRTMMQNKKIQGSFAMGGITSMLVDMLKEGLFQTIMDVQCFDLGAVESIRTNPRHREITALHYASPSGNPICASSLADSLDVVILGATEMDTSFNVNVHTDSSGKIMGGSGGHSDTAAGAKLAIIVAPLMRAGRPLLRDRVKCISTPGSTIDALVTQFGIVLNPARQDLLEKVQAAGLPTMTIEEMKALAETYTGVPHIRENHEPIVAKIQYRTGEIIDELPGVPS